MSQEGSLGLRLCSPGAEFRFNFLGRTFMAVTRPSESGIELDLSARLGHLPYSAESVVGRYSAQAIVAATRQDSPFRLAISRQQQIYFLAGLVVAQPLRPADLMAAIVALLLEARPYLEALQHSLAAWNANAA